jgi:transposase
MNNLVKNILTEIVNNIDEKKENGKNVQGRGRPRKCSNTKYIEAIYYVLKTGISWNDLVGYSIKGDTARKKFNYWCKNNVFKLLWIILVDIYSYFKLDFEQLFIDGSHIKNLLGNEMTGRNTYDRSRLSTKITYIVDDNGAPVGIDMGAGNTHDIKFLLSTVENIEIDIESTKFLIGDKGYISNDLRGQLMEKYTIKLITPRKRKRGQIGKTRGRKPKDHEKLRGRYIVEHSFSWMKQYGRLFRRKDKLQEIFKGFVMFGSALIVANKLNRILCTDK